MEPVGTTVVTIVDDGFGLVHYRFFTAAYFRFESFESVVTYKLQVLPLVYQYTPCIT
jgi:hypothetical protein